jgi:flagellar L-ring protein FlgH
MCRRTKVIFSILCFSIFLAGCMSVPLRAKQSSDLERNSLPASPPPPISEGSLWSPRTLPSLFNDVKARDVGDIVTISIVESARASKNATTSTERQSGMDSTWSGVFSDITSGITINGKPMSSSAKIDLANTFDGKGQTTRTSFMTAQISARVIDVFPNGNLLIRGSRQVRLNNEDQYINIQGVIRPVDISSNNIILSTYIAEAKIELSGYGAVSDKQRVGWLSRMLDWAWPF